MTHRKKFMLTCWHVIAIGTLATAFFLIALIAYWSLQPFGTPIVEFPEGLDVVQKEVKAGESITINAPYCKNSKTATTLTRSFQDKITYFIPVQQANIPKGCNLNYQSVVEIPRNLPTDTYTYVLDFTYQVNPIKTVEYHFESDAFNVVNVKE